MRSYRSSSLATTDNGPGVFITADTVRDTMLEQGRPIIGGARAYGSEYDGYYKNRRWAGSSNTLTFSPTSPVPVAKAVTAKAVKKVAKKIVSNAKARLEAQAAGLGYNHQFLTPSDLQAAPLGQVCTTPGMKIRSGGAGRGLARGLRGLGAATAAPAPDPATVDVVTAVREIYGVTVTLKPLLGVVGDHPVGFIAMLLLAIGGGAALGGYIGSGIKTTTK